MVFAGGLYAQAQAPHGHYAKLGERSVPVVLVNAAVDWLDFPRVSCDDVDGRRAGDGARHRPRPHPHRPGARGRPTTSPRSASWRAPTSPPPATTSRCRRAFVAHAIFSLEGGQAAGDELLRHGATAVICASDPLALGGVRAARRLGLHVPGDVSVVGYDDSLFMRYTDPPLTTVRQPIEAMGRAAVDRLVSQLEGRRDGPGELLFAPELVVRGSTGPAR